MSAVERTWWGWHRLSDEWARRLVERADVQPGDLVLDIGAGSGVITTQLLRAGARVVAVELHSERAAALRAKYAGAKVRVVRADATQLRLPRQPFRVVSNPPFAATTALLRTLLQPDSQMMRAELIVPRHVAARWSTGRGSDAHRWASSFDARSTIRVPRAAFSPMPPDDAAVLSIQRVDPRSNRAGVFVTRRRART